MQLHVSVLDAKGNPVTNLKKSDFKLLIDGPEVPISSVDVADEPVSFIFLIDTSASTDDQIGRMQQHALRWVNK